VDINVFPQDELVTVFRVLRTALTSGGLLSPRERRFLATYARITGYSLPAGGIHVIAADEVAIATAHRRKRLLQLAGLAVLLNNPVRPGSVEFLESLAQRLGTQDEVVAVARALLGQNLLAVKLRARRRVFRAMLREIYLADGAMGIVRFFAVLLFKAAVNRDKLWKYKRLGLLPDGTLGREYWKHLTEIGFGFPGEPGGIPDAAVFHDVGHVLAGYDTTPMGEIQQGCFQGGSRREDGFAFVQFAVLQFHQGVQVTPVAPPETGNFDPAKVLWAIHRGAQCSVDITHQWDFWPLMSLPIDEARERCGLLPKLQEAA
jgi:hypothetical protein